MLNNAFKSLLLFILIIAVLTGSIGAVSADSLHYISVNGVSLEKPSAYKVDSCIRLSGITDKEKIKILVIKDKSQIWYDVKLIEGKFDQKIWLTSGKGMYEIAIMINTEGRKYSFGPKISVENVSDVNKFLVPSKHVESDNEKIIARAKEIVKGKLSDREKAEAIYNWVKDNINYDYEKLKKHKEQNYDNAYGALLALETKKGVCYDYSALMAALGRAAGLQVKMVKGEGISASFRGLHAWNEIYISEEKRWINADATFASVLKEDYFDNENFGENHIKSGEY